MEFFVERYKNREELTFECEVITPMFLSGADPNQVELRAASIKGALRFWWRAIVGQRYKNIEEMKEAEGRIFGNTELKSRVSLKIEPFSTINYSTNDFPEGELYPVKTSKSERPFRLNILDYLAFGIAEYNREKHKIIYNRPYIMPLTIFKMIIEYDSSQKDDLLKAIGCLNYYGGLGAKSRNGFGSISITPMDKNIKLIRYSNFQGNRLKYSCFNSNAAYFESYNEFETWEKALSELGIIYRTARLSLEGRHSFKKRPLIAKPLIVKGEINIQERHSKPYFLHVSKHGGKYKGSILFLPYHYHDENLDGDYMKACDEMNNKIENGDRETQKKLKRIN